MRQREGLGLFPNGFQKVWQLRQQAQNPEMRIPFNDYRTTSQCPPLSGPMRRRRPSLQRRFSCHATPLSVMPRVTDSSPVVSDGVFRRKSRIFSLVFSLVFSPVFSLPSSPVLTPASDGNGMTVTNGSPSTNRGLALLILLQFPLMLPLMLALLLWCVCHHVHQGGHGQGGGNRPVQESCEDLYSLHGDFMIMRLDFMITLGFR